MPPDFWMQFFGAVMGTLGGWSAIRLRVEMLERRINHHETRIEALEGAK